MPGRPGPDLRPRLAGIGQASQGSFSLGQLSPARRWRPAPGTGSGSSRAAAGRPPARRAGKRQPGRSGGRGWYVLGYANYLLVWGSIHQWGFAWQDRTLTRARWRSYALAAGGAALLAGLLASRRYMVDMVGSGNTNPPSIALLAFAAAQCGLVIAPSRPPPGCWPGRACGGASGA